MALARNYFDEKGRRAEAVIHALATKTFLTDWCYPNPKKPDGKELCDLLVVFDDIAIIWQVKDLKVDDSGQYKKAEVEKNLRQLSGARRHLFDLKVPIELDNPRRGRELFKPADIRVIHLISVLMGEENLLAKYLQQGRSFSWMDKYDSILIDDTVWPAFSHDPQFLAKKREDEISYGWDSIIDRAHDGSSAAYERAARELARPNRFARRVLSKLFMDAYKEYWDCPLPVFRRMAPVDDTTYCFLFMEDGHELPRKRRTAMLTLMCFVARGLPPYNNRVVGIATEKENRSYDRRPQRG